MTAGISLPLHWSALRSHHDLTGEVHRVVRKQIRENKAIHERILGRPMLKVLRPPYAAHGERIGRIGAQLGYGRIALRSVDTHDWKRSSSARFIARRAKHAPPGSVVLMRRTHKRDGLGSALDHQALPGSRH